MAIRLQFRNPVTGKFVKMKPTNTIKTFETYGSNVIKQARKILNEKEKRNKGTLFNSLSYNIREHKSGLSFAIDFGRASKYWKFVDEGVRGIGYSDVKNKSKKNRRGIARGMGSPFKFRYANPGGKLVQALKKQYGLSTSHAFLAGYKIKRRGLERTQFITKSVKDQYKKLPEKVLKAFALDVEELLNKAIPNKIMIK